MRFPISIKKSPRLGRTPGIFISCTKRVQPHCCPQQKDPDMLFLKGAIFVYLSLVGQSRTRLACMRHRNRERYQYRSKNRPLTTFWD